MPLDLTLTPCTYEDGSEPGQAFPCAWDATTSGNGVGTSFVMNGPGSFLYADGTLICDGGMWAADDMTVCEPLPEQRPEAVQVDVTPQGTPVYANETLTLTETAAPAHAELAHTGPTDPALWMAALIIVTVGAVMAPFGKRAKR